jgi:MFS family permease
VTPTDGTGSGALDPSEHESEGGAQRRAEIAVVYVAAVVQGVALVTFPAASSVFTSPAHYGLSSTEYGTLFLPQVLTAITASLLGGAVARRLSLKRVYLAGLVADLLSMSLLVTSQFCTGTKSLAYVLLLAATGFLGVGFGLVVPALNIFTADFHHGAVDRAVLVLNALLGLGTASAPVLVAVFLGLGAWWGLPVVTAALLAVLMVASVRLPLRTDDATDVGAGTISPRSSLPRFPRRFFLFAAFAVLYGVCETMNGNWSEPYLSKLGASATVASLALTAFWAMVTIGRLFFAWVERSFPTTRTFQLLPFVVAVVFAVTAVLPHGSSALGVLTFAVAGLGCSALLPLTISFGQEQLVVISTFVAGGIIAFYQLGYGIAAFGAGPLQSAGVALSTIFGLSAVVALVMGLLSFVLARPHHRLPRLHPRPASHLRRG